MHVSKVSSGFSLSSPAVRSASQQGRADFRALAKALQANDLDAARQAFTALQRDIERATPLQARGAITSTAPRRAAIRAVGAALESGDVAGAQKALAALQQAHHQRRHDGGDAILPVAAAALAQATSSAPGSRLDLRA